MGTSPVGSGEKTRTGADEDPSRSGASGGPAPREPVPTAAEVPDALGEQGHGVGRGSVRVPHHRPAEQWGRVDERTERQVAGE